LATSGSQIGTSVTVEDQANHQRRSIFNSLKLLTRLDEPDNNGQTGSVENPHQPTVYSYDELGNLIQVTQGAQTRTLQYCSLSRLKLATHPESGTIQYLYDPNGNLTQKTDARGVVISYTYDALNRLLQKSYAGEPVTQPQTPTVNYTYDNLANAKGKLIKTESAVSTTAFTAFDIQGRATASKQTTDGREFPMTYVYNLSGALIEQNYPSGRAVKNIFNSEGELSLVRSRKNAASGYWNYADSFTYHAGGGVAAMQLGNGRWESTQVNLRRQPNRIALGTVRNATDVLRLDYSYGTTVNNGNVLSQTITVPSVGSTPGFTAAQSYTYDNLNRLSSATETIGGNPSWKQSFVFDIYGNRTFDEANTTTLTKSCGTSPNFTVCAADRKVQNPEILTTNNQIKPHQDGDGIADYAFDASGNNTKNAGGQNFVYDGENRQIEVRNGGTLIGQYYYDGDGKRVKKVVPAAGETTIFVYGGGAELLAEYSTVLSEDPRTAYITADSLGSPRINTGAEGAVIARHDYRPFGEEIATSTRTPALGYKPDQIRKKFTGYERDDETNLDFAQARYFNYPLGRFQSPDPLHFQLIMLVDPQLLNLYVYARNNPIRWTDPTGEKVFIRGGQATMEALYDMVGGKASFDKYFIVVDGEVHIRPDVDLSVANAGVQNLAGLVNASESYLFYVGNRFEDIADAFDGALNEDGDLTNKGKAMRDSFRGVGYNTGGGTASGVRGRPSTLFTPGQLANGDPLFSIIAVNSDALMVQTGVGRHPTMLEMANGTLVMVEQAAQTSGLFQTVSPASYFIHEGVEAQVFARTGFSSPTAYINAHRTAIVREAAIRRDLGLTGGFAGGLQTITFPRR
jgi:RHS repeat-associated protein